MRGHATIDNKYIKYGMLDNISFCGCPIPTPPVLAGTWGQSFDGHPSFEKQMQAIRAKEPQINCFSHFVYSWMEPESDRLRKAGKATGLEAATIPN